MRKVKKVEVKAVKLPRMVESQFRNDDGVLVTLCKPAVCRGSSTFSKECR